MTLPIMIFLETHHDFEGIKAQLSCFDALSHLGYDVLGTEMGVNGGSVTDMIPQAFVFFEAEFKKINEILVKNRQRPLSKEDWLEFNFHEQSHGAYIRNILRRKLSYCFDRKKTEETLAFLEQFSYLKSEKEFQEQAIALFDVKGCDIDTYDEADASNMELRDRVLFENLHKLYDQHNGVILRVGAAHAMGLIGHLESNHIGFIMIDVRSHIQRNDLAELEDHIRSNERELSTVLLDSLRKEELDVEQRVAYSKHHEMVDSLTSHPAIQHYIINSDEDLCGFSQKIIELVDEKIAGKRQGCTFM